MERTLRQKLKSIGPGIALAATGLGAGDMIAAAVAGNTYGNTLLWAVVFGAALKFVLNEGIARWQLVTGETLLEAWVSKLGRWAAYPFVAYLFLWSFIVAGALMSACGLAGYSLFPVFSVRVWGVIHALVALALVYFGRYAIFERIMKVLILGMSLMMLISLIWLKVDWSGLVYIFWPTLPKGSVMFTLGVMGGIGGSVTVMSYAYWLREKNWTGTQHMPDMRLDLFSGYAVTALFGMAIILIAASVEPGSLTGKQMILVLAEKMGKLLGPAAETIFLLGFWGAVFSSMLGVWQGVPYIFQDFMRVRAAEKQGSKKVYYGYLLYLAIPPMGLLLFDKPVWIIIAYAVTGALFMPFLATTLLMLNGGKKYLGAHKNSWFSNLLLVLSLLIFGYLFVNELIKRLA